MNSPLAILRSFAACRSGNIALTAALSLPALITAGAVALEMSQATTYQAKLQGMADSAAIAAAREMRLGNATNDTIVTVARNRVSASAAGLNIIYAFAGEVSPDKRSITVKLSADVPAALGAAIGLVAPSVTATAVARVMGGAPVCAVALNTTDSAALSLEKLGKMDARRCAVYSNSKHQSGLQVRDSAQLTSAFTCSSGGFSGGSTAFSPSPDTDCPVFPDPLASRPPPQVDSCDPARTNLDISGMSVYLTPGTYCGGIRILKGTAVTMQPGVYVIKDGPLEIGKGSSLAGVDVGIYFTGSNAGLDMKKNSSISLKAPRTGPLAGMLFYQDRATAADNVKFEISSDDAGTLLGTIYLPRGRLYLGGDKPVAQSSAYTIVVANKIEVSAGPTVVLNSDYSASEVPVPQGVGPLSNEIALQR